MDAHKASVKSDVQWLQWKLHRNVARSEGRCPGGAFRVPLKCSTQLLCNETAENLETQWGYLDHLGF